MKGKVVMITGAAAGIGKAAAVELARLGARVVLVCRSEARGAEVLAAVRSAGAAAGAVGGGGEVLAIDLASLPSVRQGAAAFRARHLRLDVLINNAGVISVERQESADGYELTFAVNQLSHFLLTELLMPCLEAAGAARIVNVASDAHRRGVMHWDDLQLTSGYRAWRAYAQSKLANILFTRELARRLDAARVTANAVHPGVVATELVRDTRWYVRWGFATFGLTPERGAEGLVKLASDPGLAAVTGQYFNRTRQATPSPAARDDQAASRLWEVCERLTAAGGSR